MSSIGFLSLPLTACWRRPALRGFQALRTLRPHPESQKTPATPQLALIPTESSVPGRTCLRLGRQHPWPVWHRFRCPVASEACAGQVAQGRTVHEPSAGSKRNYFQKQAVPRSLGDKQGTIALGMPRVSILNESIQGKSWQQYLQLQAASIEKRTCTFSSTRLLFRDSNGPFPSIPR